MTSEEYKILNSSQELLINDDIDTNIKSNSSKLSLSRIFWGTLICSFLVFNSIGQSEYDQYQFHDMNFSSYYMLTWFSMSLLSLSFIILLSFDYVIKLVRYGYVPPIVYYNKLFNDIKDKSPLFSFRYYIKIAFILAPILFFSTYTWYISLSKLPVAVNSAMFRALLLVSTFVLSVIMLNEQLSISKLSVLLVVVIGIIMVGVGKTLSADDSVPNDKVIGYLLVLISSISWSFYAVLYGRYVGDTNLFLVVLNQTLMGIIILCFFWILIPIWWAFNVEPSLYNAKGKIWLFLFYNGLFAATYFIAYALGCSVTSPFYVSLTSLFGVPVSLGADALFHHAKYNATTIIGMVLIMLGVICMNILKTKQ